MWQNKFQIKKIKIIIFYNIFFLFLKKSIFLYGYILASELLNSKIKILFYTLLTSSHFRIKVRVPNNT